MSYRQKRDDHGNGWEVYLDNTGHCASFGTCQSFRSCKFDLYLHQFGTVRKQKSSHQKKIILNEVMLEILQRQFPGTKLLNKIVLREIKPYFVDILTT